MAIESLRTREGSARYIFEASKSNGRSLIGEIVKGAASRSYYLILGVNEFGPLVDRGLKAYRLETSFLDSPGEITIPWAANLITLGPNEKNAITARLNKRIAKIREEYTLSPSDKGNPLLGF